MPEERELDEEIRACGNCEVYVPDRKKENNEWIDDEWGRCHRFPPVVFKTGEINTWKFPKIHKENFCGEFSQRLVGKMKIEIEGADNAD